ncbi:MAG: 4-hydroxy-3-methylbut-2-en-1-yl diphosphate synthase [Myxococcales bacterium]|nr:4-hydroxy-3-methylbut-2-en-1-yl diphosphate synthase [Myxococcales bacterium]
MGFFFGFGKARRDFFVKGEERGRQIVEPELVTTRRSTRRIQIGHIPIGGDAPISVQSMTTVDTRDVMATVNQLRQLKAAGCDIARIAVPDLAAAEALETIMQRAPLPVVADIHFNYKFALMAAEAGISGLRFNPGNIGSAWKVRELVASAKDHQIPIRIGVNAGSVEKRLLKNHEGEPTPEMLVESAMHHVHILEDENFHDIKISVKSSQVPTMVAAYRLLADRVDYPLHLGVTEAGTPRLGGLRSALGIGLLIAEGIGDTLRVSLTADPVEEVAAGIAILKDLGLRQGGLSLVSCPTCGRCTVDMISATERIEKKLGGIQGDVRVAVMGCEVNGPGEAKAADVGIAYGHGVALLVKQGKIVKRLKPEEAEDALVAEVHEMANS